MLYTAKMGYSDAVRITAGPGGRDWRSLEGTLLDPLVFSLLREGSHSRKGEATHR